MGNGTRGSPNALGSTARRCSTSDNLSQAKKLKGKRSDPVSTPVVVSSGTGFARSAK